MKRSSLKVWNVRSLFRGLGVARSIVKSVFEFKDPVRRKAKKNLPLKKVQIHVLWEAFSSYWDFRFKD